MNLNTQGVSRNGNQGSSGQARPESVAGREGLGRTCSHPANLGAGTEQSTRASHDNAPPDSRRCNGHQASAASATSRTQRLEDLRAQAKELYQDAFGPHKAANHEELAHQWRAVSKEISTLESSFVLYQGCEIEATLVNYLSGNIPTSTVDHDGDEELFRDERGCYYLRRTLNLLASESDDPQPASGRTHVHRINVNAAILWATTRLNSNTLDLRNDAASLLTEGRFYRDPAPTAPMRQVPVLLAELNGQDAHEPTSDVQVVGPLHRFTFDYPATRKACGRQRVIELDDAQMGRASELAAIFGLTPTRFLRGLVHYNNLPGQMRGPEDRLRGSLQASHVAFACMDEAMARRIERAALARKQTVDEFVAESLGGDVDMWEECMLVHPVTGELLEADYEELYAEIDDKLTAPPIGREDDPWFQASRQARAEAGGMTVRLEAEAAALVQRYLDTTPYDYTARDIVSGSVAYALGQAFAGLPEAQKFGNVDSAVFHDGGWGYVEEEIRDAQDRRTGATAAPTIEAGEAA